MERIVDTPGAFLETAKLARDYFGISPWFRGQDVASWPLRPKVARPDHVPAERRVRYETSCARRFMTRARTRHGKCPGREEYSSWLFLMQHYGIPTRLLDWTESMFVAGFFAVFNHKHWKDDGAIYALDHRAANAALLGQGPNITEHDQVGQLATALPFIGNDYDAMRPEVGDMARAIDQISIAMLADEVDLRMLVQQSVFTVHGSSVPDGESGLAEGSVLEFVIPAAFKEDLAHMLASAGMRLSSVFPDLDHLAEEIRDRSLHVGIEEADQADGLRA